MKLFIIVLTFVASCYAQYSLRSPPFSLIILSSNTTLNGTLLYACHEGAAIDGLCRGAIALDDQISLRTTFTHNITSETGINTQPDKPGPLSYNWVIGGGNITQAVESTMRLVTNPSSNVAVPIFFPTITEYQVVYFDDCNSMYIERYLDDAKVPIETPAEPIKDFNWYICSTYYGYRYDTLAWKMGIYGAPQNPTCQSVLVKRVFLSD